MIRQRIAWAITLESGCLSFRLAFSFEAMTFATGWLTLFSRPPQTIDIRVYHETWPTSAVTTPPALSEAVIITRPTQPSPSPRNLQPENSGAGADR